MPFPSEWPREALKVCADWFSAGNLGIPPLNVAEAAYEVEGFALAQFYALRDGSVEASSAPPPELSNDERATLLRSVSSYKKMSEAAAPIDWMQILSIVVSIIQSFWNR